MCLLSIFAEATAATQIIYRNLSRATLHVVSRLALQVHVVIACGVYACVLLFVPALS